MVQHLLVIVQLFLTLLFLVVMRRLVTQRHAVVVGGRVGLLTLFVAATRASLAHVVPHDYT